MTTPTQIIPHGLCHCGCGRPTKISPVTESSKGWIAGQPRFFIIGHHSRAPRPDPEIVVANGVECLRVALTKGAFTLIDLGAKSLVLPWYWYLHGKNRQYAARRVTTETGDTYISLLHREIMGLERDDPREVDHRDTNQSLDNRKQNLRIVTHLQNSFNSKMRKHNLSGLKGAHCAAARMYHGEFARTK